MTDMDPRIAAFFADAEAWREELSALRATLRDSGLGETFKWRSPCYVYRNANVATLWGMKSCCAVAFFKGALLKDPDGLLLAPGENSRSMRTLQFTSAAEIRDRQATLQAYLEEAIAVEKAGLKVEFPKDDLAFPDELSQRLDVDPDLQAAFAALTPGRRRGYVLHFSQPKQSKTRFARIDKATPRIRDGKGLHDR